MASIDGIAIDCALAHAASQRGADPRYNCIAIALYFVEAVEDSHGGKAINTIKFLRDLDKSRMNPFASYYFGWFPYGTSPVYLGDEPEFFDRGYQAERAVFRRDRVNFTPSGYDLILCDVTDFRLSAAVHVKLSNLRAGRLPIEEALLEMSQRPGEESPASGAWAVEGGLLASQESVVGAVARYLDRKGGSTLSAYQPIEVADLDIVPGDWNEIEV